MNPIQEMIQRRIDITIDSLYTCLPATIVSYDAEEQTATCQVPVGVYPLLVSVPVQHQGGKSTYIEVEVNEGDEGMVFFSKDCVEEYILTGEVSTTPPSIHSLNSAFYTNGFRSRPNAFDAVNEGIKLQVGSNYLHLTDKLTTNVDVVTDGDVISDGVSLLNHTHSFNYLGAGQGSTQQSGSTDVGS